MRPGLPLAGGVTAFALVMTGAFIGFKVIRPQTAVAGPPLTWEIAPSATESARPAPTPAAHPRGVHAPAPRRSPRPVLPHVREKQCPPPAVDPLGGTVASLAGPKPARTLPSADAFQVRLEPSPQTPHGYAYADALRAALARQGAVAARPGGRVIWSVDRQYVAKLGDGSRIAVVGGYGVTELSFRQLTPETCRLLAETALGARASVAYPGGRADPASVDGPRALCARLGPAFDAWRRAAPSAPLDLVDLDRRDLSISRPGGGSAPAQPGPARQSLFY